MSDKSMATRVQAEHKDLAEVMKEIRAKIAAQPSADDFDTWKMDLLWFLRDFQSALQKHFDLEEIGGFMEEVVSIAPHFVPRVEQLKQEHDEVIPKLNGIIDSVKRLSATDFGGRAMMSDRLLFLLESLEEHEALERELIQDVYFQDIGVGD